MASNGNGTGKGVSTPSETATTESLHGEAQTRLDAAHYFDLDKRACVIDASTLVGRDLNRLFTGFLNREFGADAFEVGRVEDHEQHLQEALV